MGSCEMVIRDNPAALASSTVAGSGLKSSGHAHTKSIGTIDARRSMLCTMLLPSPTYTNLPRGLKGQRSAPNPSSPSGPRRVGRGLLQELT